MSQDWEGRTRTLKFLRTFEIFSSVLWILAITNGSDLGLRVISNKTHLLLSFYLLFFLVLKFHLWYDKIVCNSVNLSFCLLLLEVIYSLKLLQV